MWETCLQNYVSAIACEVTRMRQRSGDGYLMRRQQIGVKQMRCVYTLTRGAHGVGCERLCWREILVCWLGQPPPLSSYRLTDTRGMYRNYTSGLLQNLLGLSLNLQWNSGTFLLNFFFFRLYSYDTHMILIWYSFHFQKKLVKSLTVLLFLAIV